MFVVADRSVTEASAVRKTIRSGLNAYFNDATAQADAAGITQIALASFPNPGSCDSTTCGSSTCMSAGSPPLGLGLTAFNAGNVGTFTTWTGSIALKSSTATASYSDALQDAVNAAIADFNTYPTSPVYMQPYEVVVLVLGSEPTVDKTCAYTPAALAGIAATGYASAANVRTFVVYGGTALASTAEAIAVAGNGGYTTPQYWYPFTTSTDVSDALTSIRTQSFPCWVPLPSTVLFDPSSPLVEEVGPAPPSGPGTVIFSQVFGGVSNCTSGGGYYYDNDANPTRIFLCPQTCQVASTANTSLTSIHYHLGCPALYATSNVPAQTYTGTCPTEGTAVEWRYLTYNTLIPSQTSVQFTVQTPTMAMPQQVAWAGNGNPGVCQLGGPAGCPIDLVSALDGNAAQGPAFGNTISVGATLNPNAFKSVAPTIQGWQVFYDCPFVQ